MEVLGFQLINKVVISINNTTEFTRMYKCTHTNKSVAVVQLPVNVQAKMI